MSQDHTTEPANKPAKDAGRPRPAPAPPAARAASLSIAGPVLLFLIILLLSIGGGLYLRSATAIAHKVAVDNLTAVAHLKVREIVSWRAERFSNGSVLMENPALPEAVARWLANPEATNTEPLLLQFRSWQTHYHYSDVLLVDASGQVRLSLSGRRDRVHETTATTLAAALRDRRVMLTDLHTGPGNLPPRINVVVPLAASRAAASGPLGALILQTDADAFLFPMIQAWPTPSASAETLLIRQEGDAVLYLNELRHRKRTALALRLPIGERELPAARAVRGETGEMAGMDYRNVPVLAHVLAVPDTTWFMVAKVDQAEINAPIRRQVLLPVALLIGLVLLAGLSARLLWRRQQIRFSQEKEESVRASELRYRRLFEAARDGVLILDAETGQVVDVNPFMLELLGVTREVFLGKKVWELGFFKDLVANEANFTELKAKEYIRYDDMALEGHDGKRHEVEFVSNVYLVDGHKVIQCNIRDISERKRIEGVLHASELRYRRLFEAARDGVVILDAETGQVTDVNPFMLELLGYSRETFLGKKIWELGFLKDWIANEANFAELKAKDFIHYDNLALETSTGQRIEAEFYSHVYRVDDQKVIQCNIRDITAYKREIAAARKDTQELHQKTVELERFLYTASHDLKSPVVTIRAFIGFLETDMAAGDAGRVKNDLSFIRAATEKMAQLLAAVLEIARVGRVVSEPVTVTLRALADTALMTVAGQIALRGITVRVDDRAVALYGDPLRLDEIWQNLVDNACKFMGDRKDPRIEIGAETRDAETVFFVRDNGVGVDPRHQAKMFDLFEKLDSKTEGTGLGLALVKRIVELYAGRIWVESNGAGQGTCFYFTLPEAVVSQKPEGGGKAL
jgi:PAS domain S-box-containing protein